MNPTYTHTVAFLQSGIQNTLHMKRIVFAILFTLTGFVAWSQDRLKEGIRQMDNENYTAALSTFGSIASADPKNASIYYYIGEVQYRMEQYAEAEKAYRKGLTVNAQCAECKVGIGKLLLDEGKAMEAQEQFESAARLGKKHAHVFGMIGDAYLLSKKPNAQKAIQYLTTARDMDTGNALYWAHLGDAYKMAGDNGEAMTQYEIAVKKDPNISSAYISMARIWAIAKQYDLAIPILQQAIELAPNDAQPYKELVELYIRVGEYQKVTPLLEKYVSLIGTDIDAKVRYVKFLTFQAKDYDRAIKEGEALLKTNPDQYTLHRWLAWAYGEKGMAQESYDHSKALFDDIGKNGDRKAFPSDYEYWAKAALKLGLLDEAAHIYRKYIELDSTRAADIYDQLANAYYAAKDFNQTLAYYDRKKELKPLNNVDYWKIGISNYQLNQLPEADSAFVKVLDATPDFLSAWIYRANVALKIDSLNTEGRARPFFEKYIEYAIAEKEKNKQGLTRAAIYLAQYWVNAESDPVLQASMEMDSTMTFDNKDAYRRYCLEKAKGYYELLLELEPSDELVKGNLKAINDMLATLRR
jgi:tetratricopeptide (TPR) repeat protein